MIETVSLKQASSKAKEVQMYRNDVDFLYAFGIIIVLIGHSHPSDKTLFENIKRKKYRL